MKRLQFSLIAIIFTFLYLSFISKELAQWGGDSAKYILLAKAIAKGEGYCLNYLPDKPKALYYHFFLPLLLSPLIKLFGVNFLILRAFIAVLAGLAVPLIYLLFQEDKEVAFNTMMLFAFSTVWLYFSNLVLTEVPYVLFSLLSLISLEKFLNEEKSFTFSGILATIFILVTIFTRFIGVMILFSFFIYVFLYEKKKKTKLLLPFFSFFIIFSIWEFRSFLYEEKLFYFLHDFFLRNPYNISLGKVSFLDLGKRWLLNFNYYLNSLYVSAFPFLREDSNINLLFLCFSLIFLWEKTKKNNLKIYDFYYLLFIFSIPFWFWKSIRFVLPISFLSIFYFLGGVRLTISYFFKNNKGKVIFYLVFLLLFSLNYWKALNFIAYRRASSYHNLPVSYREFLELNYWIRDNLKEKQSLIISRKPTITALFTGHPSLCYPYQEEIWEIKNFIFKNNAKYIIFDRFSPQSQLYLKPLLIYYKDYFRVTKINGGTYLFEVIYHE